MPEQSIQHLEGFDPRPLFKGAPTLHPGTSDFIVGGDELQVLGRMAAYYLGYQNEDGHYFKGITVIAPPFLVWDVLDETLHSAVIKGIEDVHGCQVPPEAATQFLNTITVVRCERLDISEVETHITSGGKQRIVLVPLAEKYRDHELTQEWALGRSGALFSEDVWVPHVKRLATSCLKAAKPLGDVVIFSATGVSLVKDSNLQLLTDVEDFYPVVLGHGNTPKDEEQFVNEAPRWLALAAAGRAEQAFEELHQSTLKDSIKRQVALHIAVRAGDSGKTIALLQEHTLQLEQLAGEDAARLGKMAFTAGDFNLARIFFATALAKLSDQMWLEETLRIVTLLKATDLVQSCWDRLQTLFPHSKFLEKNLEYRLLQICDAHSTPLETEPSRAGFGEFHNFLADALCQDADYLVLFEQIRNRWPQRIHLSAICIGIHALGHQNFAFAIDFAVIAFEESQYEFRAVRVLLGTVHRMLLLEVSPSEGINVYKVPLLLILRYLANHSNEARLRADLSSALSIESAGSIGLPMMASIALELIGSGTSLQDSLRPDAEPADLANFKVFFERAIRWMSEQDVIEPGVTRLPEHLVSDNADRLIENLENSMQFAARNLESPEDLGFFEKCVYLVCLLQPYASSPFADLDALRLLGAKYCLHGQPQRARDIAEQILLLAGDSSERQRMAWGSYADIYSRTRSPIDALIGLACAATSDAKLEAGDLFQEAYTLLRVARDLHLYDIARAVLPGCRQLYEIQGLGELGQQRLDGIEIGLEVAQSRNLDITGLFELLERTRVHCEAVIQGSDELFPAAALFLQIAGSLERAGQELPGPAMELRSNLQCKLGTDIAAFLNAISTAFPSTEEVVWLHNRLGTALNSEDTAADQLSIVMAAHRLLLPRTPDISAQQAAVAVELLSDRGLEIKSPGRPLESGWAASFILELSQKGVGVLLLATDTNGEVVAVLAEHGKLRVIRPRTSERSFIDRLNAWSATYPYRYGLIEREEGNGEFYTSMQEFELPLPDTENVLVIAEPALQQLAFNLLPTDNGFAGESKAIGLAPSLTWFESTSKRPLVMPESRLAWISCAPESDAYGTLEMLFARLSPVFDQHGFKTDITGKVPKNLDGASIAIVTAHGGLTSEQRYIHTIADEQGLKESPLALARALAGVELVILFVCSGGRVDRHPLSNTTVSLPKMLLDRGCRAVIASPWPLSAVVPGNWLERFMEAWDSGDTVLQANFKANLYVKERLGPEPGLALAMMAYGDVIMTKNPTP